MVQHSPVNIKEELFLKVNSTVLHLQYNNEEIMATELTKFNIDMRKRKQLIFILAIHFHP